MHEYRSKSTKAGSWRFVLGIVCVALVAVFGTIQTVHSHPQGDVSESSCALCVTTHVTVQVATTVEAPVVTPVVSYVEPEIPVIHTVTITSFALFTRPPPVDSVPA